MGNTALRVSDRSGTPQGCNQPEEYSPGSLAGINSERDPRHIRPKGTLNTSTNSE